MQIENIDPLLVIGICLILGGICLLGLGEVVTKPSVVRLYRRFCDLLKRTNKDTLIIVGYFTVVACIALGGFIIWLLCKK